MSQECAVNGREYVCPQCRKPIPWGHPRMLHDGERYHGGKCYQDARAMPTALLTVDDAARELGVSARRVRALIDAGKLTSTRAGNTSTAPHLINRASLEKLKRKRHACSLPPLRVPGGNPWKCPRCGAEWECRAMTGVRLGVWQRSF